MGTQGDGGTWGRHRSIDRDTGTWETWRDVGTQGDTGTQGDMGPQGDVGQEDVQGTWGRGTRGDTRKHNSVIWGHRNTRGHGERHMGTQREQ